MANSTKFLLSWVIAFFAIIQVQAQINVINAGPNTFSPEDLITNVFLGDGVTVTNITYAGSAKQVGYFSNAQSDIGLERGIVMTTGEAETVVGPGSQFNSSMAGTSNTDADLEQIGQVIQPGATVNDVAVYEITFIPVADTLRFRYVFASEEYPEYTCTQFNDVFGFFIWGPGINGSFSNNAANIALVPDPSDPTGLTFTTDYVSISNVHNGNPNDPSCAPSYPMYYHDNSASLTMAYDAYTSVFTAQAIVTPCETYHIKLAIADLGDDIFDTGVFLEAKSFGTGSVLADLKTVSVDGTIVEGCSNAELVFTTPNPAENDLVLDYNIFGTATHPDDYVISKDGNPFNPGDNLVIPQGDTSVSITIQALADNIAENNDYIQVSIQKDICTVDTVLIPVKDNILVNPDLGPDTTLCAGGNGATIQLNGDLGIPIPPPPTFTYTGSDLVSNDNLNPVNAPITVTGVYPPYLGPGVLRQVCVKLKHKFDADVDLFLYAPNNAIILLSSDNGNNSRDMDICFTPTGNDPIVTDIQNQLASIFPPNGQVPFASINNLYFTGSYSPEGTFADFWSGGAQTPTNGTWRLVVYDDQGSPFGDPATGTLEEWSMTFEPLFKLNYQWDQTTDLSCLDCPDPVLTLPDQTTTYTLTVSDTYGCSVTDSITVFVQDSLDAPVVDCQIVGKDSITFAWSAVAGAATYEVNINGAGWQNVGNSLSFTVNGLNVNETVTIEVRAVGFCPAKIALHQCTTLDCIKPDYQVTVTDVNCAGSADGTITLSGTTGPYAPYSFTLGNDTNTSGSFTGLAAGNYQIIINDNLGCTYPIDTFVNEPPALSANALETQQVTCAGGNDGAGAIEVTGGTPPYTFSLNGGTDSTLTQVPAGTYPFTVTDANGCIVPGDLVISENEPITFQLQPVDPTCFGTANGQITAFNVAGGIAPYSYLWNDPNGQTTAMATNLDAGSYTVTVTDNLGCTATQSADLTAPTEITTIVDTTSAVCGGAPGAAVINTSGGAGNYSYNWSDIGPGTNQRNDLQAGTYTVTIEDAAGCTKVIDITIEAPSDMVLTLAKTNVDCNGNNTGSASVSVTGGTPPYLYQWDDPLNQTNKTAVNLPAGQYKVIVTDSKQCIQSDTISIFEPDELIVDTAVTHVDCFGSTTGAITTTVSGGTPPYQYEYLLPGGNTATTPNLTDLPAGTYILTVTDAHDCQVSLSIDILQPAAVSLTFVNSDSICFGTTVGFAQVNVSGGTAPYTYLWDNNQTTQKIENLAAGTYSVTVTDAAGCQYSGDTTIIERPEIVATLNQTPALCHDEPNGAAVVQEITFDGNVQPKTNFDFVWSTTPAQTSFDAYQLTGGQTYQVTITDKASGCSVVKSIEIGNPPELSGKLINTTDVSCRGGQDGKAEIIGEGGTPPYTYQWDANTGHQTGTIASGLPQGTYWATITDANGCETSVQASIQEPEAITVASDISNVACSGEATGSISVQASGGTPPFSFAWDNGQNQPYLSGLRAGTYELTITDGHGCIQVNSFEVTEPGAPLVLAIDQTQDVTCHGDRDGSIIANASGGTAPYAFSIDGESFSNYPNLEGLHPGEYQVIVKDYRGCLDTVGPISIHEPLPVLVDIGPNLIIDYGDTVQLEANVSNAVGNVSYAWSSAGDNELSCYDCRAPFVFPEYQDYFYVDVVDANGCAGEAKVLINVRKYTPVFVPTGFSPNDDGNNDRLYVLGKEGITIQSFSIYDRWGEQVFSAEMFDINDESAGWDGTFRGQLMPSGQYAWQLRAIMEDGRIESLQGFSTLLR